METVGFIGLGVMGKPMAQNLVKAGYPLVVHTLNRDAVDALAADGAVPATSSEEVAQKSDIVITMLPDSPDVEQVVFGANGVLAGISGGKLFVDMSTITPAVALKVYAAMQEKGVESLDAPVSGGDVGA